MSRIDFEIVGSFRKYRLDDFRGVRGFLSQRTTFLALRLTSGVGRRADPGPNGSGLLEARDRGPPDAVGALDDAQIGALARDDDRAWTCVAHVREDARLAAQAFERLPARGGIARTRTVRRD